MVFASTLFVMPVYASTSLTVDLGSVIGPVTHGAAGSLYGVTETLPDNCFIIPLHAKAFNNPAVAGSGHQQPVGAAVPVAQRIAPMGSQVSIRLADYFTGWYDYTNLTDWFNIMTSAVNAAKSANLTNVYGYELWNEPDGSWNGGKYVGGINNSDSYVQFNNVTVPTAGNYTMTIRYANGTGAPSTHYLSINGGANTTLTYPNTGGWSSGDYFGTLTVTVSLNAGANTIKFSKGTTGYAEIDRIDITGGTPVKYEAEDGTVNDAIIYNSRLASGDQNGNLTIAEFFSQSYTELKSLDPTAKAIGPSYCVYNHQYFEEFLSYEKAHNTIPDIISWHQLGGQNITADVNDYRALETSLGISPRPISLNEYSGAGWGTDEGKPGADAPLIAKFERLKIDTAMKSYWNNNPGQLGSLLASSTQRNGGWWFNKWYGDMTGNMVSVTPPSPNDMTALDGFACVDSTRNYASILFGGVNDGTVTTVINNIPSSLSSNGNMVHVRVESTPFVNRTTAVNTTTTMLEGNYAVTNNSLTLSISGTDNNSGYRVYITPYGKATNVYEAEDAAVNNAKLYSSSSASGGKYVGGIDYSDSYVDFYVKVPTANTYTMTIRYANGTGANSTQNLAYNGGPWSTVTYPATAGWGQFGTVNVSVNLTAGDNIIRLAKGTTGYAELDSITICPLVYEAELGTVNHAIIYTSANASNGAYVGGIDYSDSYVDFEVYAPAAGTYTATIRYANGTGADSTQNIAWNGGAWQTVTYPATAGWGQFGTVTKTGINLNAGRNIIRINYSGTGYAELDYISFNF